MSKTKLRPSLPQRSSDYIRNIVAILVVLCVAVIGTYFIISSHAATPIPGDINGDGTVNVFDLSLLLSSFSQSTTQCTTASQYTCDLNSDGVVNIFDLSILLSHWGATSSSSNVPANTALPVIHGYATPNSELMANYGGTWTNSPSSYTYQWQDCNSSGDNCVNATNTTGLSGEPCSPTAFCYVVSSAEAAAGDKIQVVVTAQNSSGTAAATSTAVTASNSQPVNCGLTEAAGLDGQSNYSGGGVGDNNNASCWGMATGVTGATGCTEAQIIAGASDSTITNACGAHYFAQIAGDQSYSSANKVVANAEMTGCVAVQAGATNFHMRDVLIYSQSINCENNSSNSQNGNWVDGNNEDVPSGVLVEDVTEDARSVNLEANQDYYAGSSGTCPSGNCANNTFGMILGEGGTGLRLNIFGWAKDITLNGAAGNVTTVQDSFIHDPPQPAPGNDAYDCVGSQPSGDNYDPHADPIWGDSADYVTIEHVWAAGDGGGDCVTSPIAFLSDYGAPTHLVVDDSFFAGGSAPGYGRPDAYFGKAGTCATYTTVTNNAFSNDTGGLAQVTEWNPNNTGNAWSGNITPETGQALAAPNSGSCS